MNQISKVPQVACNLATDRIVELYADRGWNIELVEAPRSISCDGNRKKVVEMLATRYLSETRSRQGYFQMAGAGMNRVEMN